MIPEKDLYELLSRIQIDTAAGYEEEEDVVWLIGNCRLESLNALRRSVGLQEEEKP